MATKQKTYHTELHNMDSNDINQVALRLLDRLLERCTLNMVTKLTGVTRTTLYRWLDESLPLDAMNVRDTAWFIMICETSPKVQMLMQRAPLSNRRLAGRLIEEEEGNNGTD